MSHSKKVVLKVLLICLAVLLIGVSAVWAAVWNLSGSLGVHDPGIAKEGNTWYVFSTGQGIQRKTSSNGLVWSQISQVFSAGLSWWKTYVPGNSGNDVWAPEIGYYNGKYWLFYSISTFGSNTSCIGLASASGNLGGAWTDNGLVIRSTSSNNYNCIDPSFVIDANNNPWLVFGSFWNGIHLTRLDPATMKPTGSLYNIARRSGGIEAPNIIYQGGYYYLFVSFDKCCSGTSSTYKIAYGRSTSITGPYLDKDGTDMLNGGGTILLSTSGNIIGPGGQSILNNSVLCYHYYDGAAGGVSKLRINDLYFSGGWPSLTATNQTPTPSSRLGSTPTARVNPTPTAGSYIKIRNRATNLCIDGMGRTSNGSNAGQYSSNTSYNQQWVLEAAGSYVKIQNRATGLYLDGMGRTANGSICGQWPSSASYNQQWAQEVAGSYVKFRNRATGLYLDGMGSTSNGADLCQWGSSSSYNQQWLVITP
ncbi:MAG: family 43 glycosylhydrolase [Firmicutes bacterium]|nr:family 43 glycosylhydrolase [Bacillota bacterium]